MRGAVRWVLLRVLAVAAILAMASLRARADDYWSLTPSQTSDWSNAANWGGTPPTYDVNTWIVNGGTAGITTPGATCGGLTLGSSAGAGTVQINGGSLRTSNDIELGVNGTGSVVQSSGSNSVGGDIYLGYSAAGSGSYNLSGGSLFEIRFAAGLQGAF